MNTPVPTATNRVITATPTPQSSTTSTRYLHSIHNGGDESRVVLDVTFWHPTLMSLRGGGAGGAGGSGGAADDEAALSAVLAEIDASLAREEREAGFSAGDLDLLLGHERRRRRDEL